MKENINCAAVSRAGEPCRGYRHGATEFCIFHDPAYRETQRRNSSNAGKASGEARRTHAQELQPVDVSTPIKRQQLLGYLISAALTGRLTHAQSTAIHKSISALQRDEENRPIDPAAMLELTRM